MWRLFTIPWYNMKLKILRERSFFMKKTPFLRFFFFLCLAVSFVIYGEWGQTWGGDHDKPSLLSSSRGNEASWEDQLNYMGYLLYRTSNINVLKGLNLSRDQLAKLKVLAEEVEQAVPPFELKGRLSPDLADVEKVYLKLMDTLLCQDAIPPGLLNEVARARGIEAKTLRDGLCYRNIGSFGDCMRCHAAPREADGKKGAWGNAATNPQVRKEQGYAHFKGYLGNKGLAALAKRSRAVDGILTENQRLMLDDFSCCLVPPQDLNSPVRIGQVEVSLWDMKLLEEVRKVPPSTWPGMRDRILQKLQYGQFLKTPDISKADSDAANTRAIITMEKARALGDEDFELQKESLVSQMKNRKQNREVPEKTRLIKQAFFLLMPGSLEVYNHMLVRCEGEH
jgi:hypothetical protein